MRINITDDEGTVIAIHDIGQQVAAYLGNLLDPHFMPTPVPMTEPEEGDAEAVVRDIVVACRKEILREEHGDTTPYEDPDERPGWALARWPRQ